MFAYASGMTSWVMGKATEMAPTLYAKLKDSTLQFMDSYITFDSSDDGLVTEKKKIKEELEQKLKDIKDDPSFKLMDEFKALKKSAEKGQNKYSFNVLNKDHWEEYMRIADKLADLSASRNNQFKQTVNAVDTLVTNFNNKYLREKNAMKDNRKQFMSDMTKESLLLTSKVKNLFTKYINQKKSLNNICDFVKFYFVACSISSKKDSGIGLIGRGVSNAMTQIINEVSPEE